jgi:hypothetical protein
MTVTEQLQTPKNIPIFEKSTTSEISQSHQNLQPENPTNFQNLKKVNLREEIYNKNEGK